MTALDGDRSQAWIADRFAGARPVPDGAMCLGNGIPVDPESVSRALGAALAEIHALPADGCPMPADGIDALSERAHGHASQVVGAANEGPYRGIDPARLLEILDEQVAGLAPRRSVVVHGSLAASHIWVHPESGLTITGWANAGLGDPHLDLAMGVRLLGDAYGYAVAGPFFDAYGLDQVDALCLDMYQLLVHLLTA